MHSPAAGALRRWERRRRRRTGRSSWATSTPASPRSWSSSSSTRYRAGARGRGAPGVSPAPPPRPAAELGRAGGRRAAGRGCASWRPSPAHQHPCEAGPVIKVKIPKDRDGKPKQFAFVNFKHEESVPYGMSLLNGIKLFGRPLKIQFRSGSSHASQEVTSPCAQHGFANGNPFSSQLLAAASSNRYERNTENVLSAGQRSFSSLDNLQKKAVMAFTWQQLSPYSRRHSSSPPESVPGCQQSYSSPQSSAPPAQWRSETGAAPRKGRVGSHPYQSGHRHHSQEQKRLVDYGSDHHFRGNREEYCQDDRNYAGWSQNYDSRSYRDGSWRPTRH